MCFSLMKHMTKCKSNHTDRPKFRKMDRELNYSSWLRIQEAERDLVEHVFVQNTTLVKIPLYAKCGMARTAERLQQESLTFQREAVDVTVNSLEMEGGVWIAKT